jgi:hypothetical protein
MESEEPVRKAERLEPSFGGSISGSLRGDGEPQTMRRSPSRRVPGAVSSSSGIWVITVGDGGDVVCEADHDGTLVVVDGMV